MDWPTPVTGRPGSPGLRRPTVRILTDDTTAIHSYQLPAEAIAAVLPALAPPAGGELLSRRLLGTAQRTADGWAVTTIHTETATYTDGAAALAAIADLDLHARTHEQRWETVTPDTDNEPAPAGTEPYGWVTSAMFDDKLREIIDRGRASLLLSVPGVYEAVSEYYSNQVLEKLHDPDVGPA